MKILSTIIPPKKPLLQPHKKKYLLVLINICDHSTGIKFQPLLPLDFQLGVEEHQSAFHQHDQHLLPLLDHTGQGDHVFADAEAHVRRD